MHDYYRSEVTKPALLGKWVRREEAEGLTHGRAVRWGDGSVNGIPSSSGAHLSCLEEPSLGGKVALP